MVKVKVSHSLIVVGAVGVRVPLYLGIADENASPFAALSFPDSKRYPFTAGLTEVFQLLHGKAQIGTRDLMLTFCAITKPC